MTKYHISICQGRDRYNAEGDDEITVLEAIGALGLTLRQPCRNGVCGACRCRLTEGGITYHWREPHGLWDRDVKQGYILPCIAYVTSDITIGELSLEKREEN